MANFSTFVFEKIFFSIYLFCVFLEIWKTEIINDISGAHKHTGAVLFQQFEMVRVGTVTTEFCHETRF